jgi:hypothetical protein
LIDYGFIVRFTPLSVAQITWRRVVGYPSPVPRGIVDSYSVLPWVTWEAVTGVGGIPCLGLLRHTLTGLWSTQAKAEGIVPRAAWHWGRDSSGISDPLGEPGRPSLFVGLPSAKGFVDGDRVF